MVVEVSDNQWRVKRVDFEGGFDWEDDALVHAYLRLTKSLPSQIKVTRPSLHMKSNTLCIYLTSSNWDIVTKKEDIPVITIRLNENGFDELEVKRQITKGE